MNTFYRPNKMKIQLRDIHNFGSFFKIVYNYMRMCRELDKERIELSYPVLQTGGWPITYLSFRAKCGGQTHAFWLEARYAITNTYFAFSTRWEN